MTAQPDDTPALLAALACEGLDTLEGAFAYSGGEDLDKPRLGTRRRTRLTLADAAGRTHELYLKRYGPRRPPPWARRRPGPARREFDNIRAARAAGVPTMRELLCREEADVAGAVRGCLFVTAVPGDALERCLDEFLRRRPDDAAELARRLAALVAGLHGAGFVHRDLYASHVFLHERGEGFELYLIDLARMFAPRWRRGRWRVKDLAQLKHSMPEAWVRAWWGEFLAAYLGPAGEARLRRYNRRIDRKVARMRRRLARRGAG